MVFETLNPTIAIVLIATIILLVINVFYRFLINQNKAQQIKDRMQELQKEAKKVKDDPAKQKGIMKETMAEQNKLMRMNLKPMLLSFVAIAIIFPYFASIYDVNVQVSDGSADFILLGKDYSVIRAGDKIQVSGADSFDCDLPCKQSIDGNLWRVMDNGNNALRFEAVTATFPFPLPLLGTELGWLWWYILSSIPLAILIRALYGIKA